MFHDDVVDDVCAVARQIDPHDVARAFVAALRPRRLVHWSALASYAFAASLERHAFRASADCRRCAICAAYERLETFPSDRFARLRDDGAIVLDDPRYVAFDLNRFVREKSGEGASAGGATFARALARVVRLESDAAAHAAERAVGIVFDARPDRKRFLGVLGACAILATPAHPGFWPTFVPYERRAGSNASPYAYPMRDWRRRDGISLRALCAFGLDAYLDDATLATIANEPGNAGRGISVRPDATPS